LHQGESLPTRDGELPQEDSDYKRRALRFATTQIAMQSAKIAQLRAEMAFNKAYATHDPRPTKGKQQASNVPVPARVESPLSPVDQTNPLHTKSDELIRLELDLPKAKNGRVEETLSMLKIGGWSVADSGIAEVAVQIDDRPPLAATRGIRRPDVGTVFPHIAGSALSGYGLLLTHRDVGTGEHTVKVSARSTAGKTIERAFRINIEAPDDAELTLRKNVPQAEIDQRVALLRAIGCVPMYTVLIHTEVAGADAASALNASLASLKGQAYEYWRAIVVMPGGAAAQPSSDVILDGLDGRIAFHTDLNAALAAALSSSDDAAASVQEFVVSLPAGDRLGPDAILELATAAALDAFGEFFYSDERCVDPTLGIQPWLKPDWAPDLMLSMNYIGHVWAANLTLIRALSRENSGFLANGFYDAALQLTERAQRIVHVPKLLSECEHTRLTHDVADETALQRAIVRREIRGEVVAGAAAGTWRIRRELEAEPLVSIIIPTCGSRDMIKKVVSGIRRGTEYAHVEIICVDNIPAERQDLKQWLRDNVDIVVEMPEQFNWSRFNNLGARSARGEYLLFLNDDIEITRGDWLHALVEHAQREEVGVVGARLLYPNGTVQHAGLFLTPGGGRHAFRYTNPEDPGPFGLAAVQREVTAVTGACQLVRRSVFDMLGGYDERHAVVRNDLDFCLRAQQKNLRVVYTPFSTLTHHELVSRGDIPDSYDERTFGRVWGADMAAGDRLFNPGLAVEDENYVPDPEPVQLLYAGHPQIDEKRIRNILAVKLDHIGDFVLAIPALKRLKRRFPQAKLTVLAAPASCVLARNESWIDGCIEFSFFDARSELGQRDISEDEMTHLELQLRSMNYDLAIDLRMHTDTRAILTKTGAKVLAGFDMEQQFPWLDFAVNWEGDSALKPKRAHVADRLLDLVSVIEGACERGWPTLNAVPADEARNLVRTMAFAANCPPGFFDRPLVCVHPGVGSPIRRWPAASYSSLVNLLTERAGVSIVLIGAGQEDNAVAAEVAQKVIRPSAVVSAAGLVPLKDLTTLLRACSIFIGNNSGPKHIAAALGVPTIGVHSLNVDPLEWGPVGANAVTVYRKVFCGPCYIGDPDACSRKLACLTGIRAEHVFRACLPYLRAAGAQKVAATPSTSPEAALHVSA
jgi:ADP-heptose:LPS heptosyltransferase/GT2 family glycosyltransferase